MIIKSSQVKQMAPVYIHLSIITVLIATFVLSNPSLKASNESSYKFGVNLAINNLTNQIVAPWDVDEDSPLRTGM